MSERSNWRWFNWSPPFFRVGGRPVKLWNIFNRCSTEGHWWGVGVLQVGHRHLFFIGWCGVSIMFIGETP